MADEKLTVTGPGSAAPDRGKESKLGVWDVLNSQFGLWVLGSVVVGLISFCWNQRLARENEQKENSQFLASMLPYLTDSRMETRLRAMQVIRGRYSPTMTDEIHEVVCYSLIDFGDFRHAVNDALRDEANKFLERCPSPPPGGAATPTPPVSTQSPGQVTPTPSPGTAQTPPEKTRVYIQIYSEEQRPRAAAIQRKLRDNHFTVLGIENVSNTNPALARKPVKPTQVRYFNPVDQEPAGKINEFLKQEGINLGEPLPMPLSAAPGTIEIWFAPTDLVGTT